MKIALVSPYDYAEPGGVNTHVAQLARSLRQCGEQVTIIAPLSTSGGAPDALLPLPGPVLTIFSGGTGARVNLAPRVPFQIRRMLRQHRFDIVHLHNPLSPLACISCLWWRPAVPDTAFVATFHEYRSTPNPIIELFKPLARRWIRRIDLRIAVSQAAVDFNTSYFPGNYTIIPNGVDVARFAACAAPPPPGLPVGVPVLLFVGRIEERKGFAYLLQAFQQVKRSMPEVALCVAGNYTARAAAPFQRYVEERGLSDVYFVGQVTDEALPRYYQAADLFCAPSVDFESFGIVLLEAMASGVPVVAADIPGYRSVLEENKQGLFFESRNVQALAAAMLELLADPDRRAAMGAAGRVRASEFDWKRVTQQVLEAYARSLRGVQGSGRKPAQRD